MLALKNRYRVAFLYSTIGTISWMLGYLIILFVLGKFWNAQLFGLFNLIISFSYVVSLIWLFGTDTAITYYLARGQNYESDSKGVWDMGISILYSRKLLIILCQVLVGLLAIRIIGITGSLLSVILGSSYALRTFSDARLRGMMLFKYQAGTKIVELIVMVFGAGFCLFVLNKHIVYPVMFMACAYIITFLITMLLFRKVSNISDNHHLKLSELKIYSNWAGIGGMGGLIMAYLDKPMVKIIFDLKTVGIYSAYYFWALAGVNMLIALVINVLFPMISGRNDKKFLKSSLNLLTIRISLFIFIGIYYLIRTGIHLFGSGYVFDHVLAVVWAIYAILFFYCNVLWWLINSCGIRGIRFTSITSLASFILISMTILILRDSLDINALIILLSLGLILNIIIANKYFLFKTDENGKV